MEEGQGGGEESLFIEIHPMVSREYLLKGIVFLKSRGIE
jgi:hypothetical protein